MKFQNKNYRQIAMFLNGLIVLQPLLVGLNAPYFIIKRFKIPEANADLFISKMNNTIQFSYFLGMLLVTLFLYIAPETIQARNNLISVGTSWSTVLATLLLLIGYLYKGEVGSLHFYYYTLAFSCFVFSVNQGFVMKVGVAQIPWFSASIPLGGITIVIFQVVYMLIAKALGNESVEIPIIAGQISFVFFWCFFTSALWTLCYLRVEDTSLSPVYYDVQDSSLLRDLWKSKYPVLMTSLGLGWLYLFYPAIMPYKLTEFKEAYRIDLVCIFTGALTCLVICGLCEFSTLGPNKNWKKTKSKWIYSPLVLIPFFFLPILFIVPLHFPDANYSKELLKNKFLMGFLGLVFVNLQSFLVSVGYSSAAMQTENEFNGNMSALNTLYSYFVMIVIILYQQGYLKMYNAVKSGKEVLPEMNNARRFFYWVGRSFYYGWKGFSFTYRDHVMSDILNER